MMKHEKTEPKPRRRIYLRALKAGVSLAFSCSVLAAAVAPIGVAAAQETAGMDQLVIDSSHLVREAQNDVTVPRFTSVQELMEEARAYIQRAFSVIVDADGSARKLIVTGGTVADALAKAGVAIGEQDLVTPSAHASLVRGMVIRVSRVQTRMRMQTRIIPFSSQTVETTDLPVGERRIVQKGQDGRMVIFMEDSYTNGVLTETKAKYSLVTHSPVDQVEEIGVDRPANRVGRTGLLADYNGTGAAISELPLPEDIRLNTDGVPVSYQTCIEGKATAYTGDPETASGRMPMPGHIAVDPEKIPYGTELYIVSADGSYVYGYAIAADTGGFVEMGNTDIDLYMDNEQMCDDWGNREVRIYVL